jgi:hypothetical protein
MFRWFREELSLQTELVVEKPKNTEYEKDFDVIWFLNRRALFFDL